MPTSPPIRNGPIFGREELMPMPSHNDLPNGHVAVFQDNSYHGEDAYVTRELQRHITLDAVFDGATGRGGADASGYAAKVLQETSVETVDGLTSLLDVTNQRLFQRGRGRFFLTTASVALKIGSTLHVVNVGDSPVFLIRGHDILPLTGTAKGATFLGIANALGRHETFAYKATSISLEAQDRLVLASDGLIENVAPTELVAIVDVAPSPEQAVSSLRQLLCEKKRLNKGRIDDSTGFRRDDATAIIRYIGLGPAQETSGPLEPSRSN
jgi:serine/threonine protein phosphatase PrpC